MTLEAVRQFALSLAQTTEEPHHHYSSFRVKGRIFVTVPPEHTHIHVFVSEAVREPALAMDPAFLDKLLWGDKVVGLRVALAGARPAVVAVQPGWAFNIIYSSGTTGTPKGIVQPHAMRWAHVARADNFGYGPDSVTLLATSLCSNTTLVCFFPAIARGGTVVLPPPKFDARTWLALAEKVRATHAMLVPVDRKSVV